MVSTLIKKIEKEKYIHLRPKQRINRCLGPFMQLHHPLVVVVVHLVRKQE
jgi:hypothetical protein